MFSEPSTSGNGLVMNRARLRLPRCASSQIASIEKKTDMMQRLPGQASPTPRPFLYCSVCW